MEITKSLIVKYQKNEEVEKLLSDFKDMVNFCIRKAQEIKTTSIKKLHKVCYEELKKRYNYNTIFYPMTYRIASQVIRTFKKNGGKFPQEIPEVKKRIVRLHKLLFKIVEDKLIIHIRPNERIEVKLELSDYHKEQLKKGEIGEIIIGEDYVYIPIKYEITLTESNEAIAIDVNENNIAFVDSKGNAGKIETGLREIKVGYQEKRKEIYSLRPYTKKFKKLMKRYSERERNRTKDILHKISKIVSELAKGKNVIMEDLKNLRKSVNKKVKKLNKHNKKIQEISQKNDFMKFRLNSFPFLRIQKYIEYKSLLNGSKVIYLNPKNTSKICVRCGGLINSLKYCPNCGLDRDINACLNLLKMWGLPSPERLLMTRMNPTLTSLSNEDKLGNRKWELEGKLLLLI